MTMTSYMTSDMCFYFFQFHFACLMNNYQLISDNSCPVMVFLDYNHLRFMSFLQQSWVYNKWNKKKNFVWFTHFDLPLKKKLKLKPKIRLMAQKWSRKYVCVTTSNRLSNCHWLNDLIRSARNSHRINQRVSF